LAFGAARRSLQPDGQYSRRGSRAPAATTSSWKWRTTFAPRSPPCCSWPRPSSGSRAAP
jgi:hypothetical protein